MSGADIRLIIADDDPAFMQEVQNALKQERGVEVIAATSSIADARSRIRIFSPQTAIIGFSKTPKQYVIDLIRFTAEHSKTSILVLCSDIMAAAEFRRAGAKECLIRPGTGTALFKAFMAELLSKLRAAPAPVRAAAPYVKNPERPFSTRFTGIITLGASVGGTEATASVLTQLPANMPPIIVTQHIPPMFSKIYAERLDNSCAMRVVEAAREQPAMPGTVYIAPGDQHLRLVKKGGRYHVSCSAGPKVSGHCPSVDVMFASVAEAAGSDAIGIILTGMGRDGADGLLKMRKNGCFTIGQDEATCVVYGMPKEAYTLGAVARQERLENIAGVLLSHLAKI